MVIELRYHHKMLMPMVTANMNNSKTAFAAPGVFTTIVGCSHRRPYGIREKPRPARTPDDITARFNKLIR
jgi:hypothetical protein